MAGAWEPRGGPEDGPRVLQGFRDRLLDGLMVGVVGVGWLLVGVVPAIVASLLFIGDWSRTRPLLDPVASAPAIAVVTDIYVHRSTQLVEVSFAPEGRKRIDADLLYGTDGLHVGQTVLVRYSLADPSTVQDEPVASRIRALLRGDVEWGALCWAWGVGWLAFPAVRRRLRLRWARQDAEQDQLLAEAPDRDVVRVLCDKDRALTVVIVDAAGERAVPVHNATFRYDRSGPHARIVVNGSVMTPAQPPGAWPPVAFRSDAVQCVLDRNGTVLFVRSRYRRGKSSRQ
jgi:hypothetical protein